jgi:hypothetical protein
MANLNDHGHTHEGGSAREGAGTRGGADDGRDAAVSRDFTLEKYSELLRALMEYYTIMRVADYFSSPKDKEFIAVLRHDVDKFPGRAWHCWRNMDTRPKLQRGTTTPLILSPNPLVNLINTTPLNAPR